MPLLMPLSMASDWSSVPQGGGSHSGIPSEHEHNVSAAYGRIQTSTLDRPPLRSHKSFPYALGTSNFTSPQTQSPLSQVANPGSSDEAGQAEGEMKLRDDPPPEMSVQMSFGGSAPASPVPQLTPTSVDDDGKEYAEEAHEAEDMDEAEQPKEEPPREKTAAERRAEKRKMKRFRLTHNQTRFLMSEFARQAHPDAAQRERLSREIPGLSPRQVQVWFQNRRAKLKRLTTDDRDRIMKSRALPEDFDMTQALHSPFAPSSSNHFTSQAQATALASPAGFPSYEGGILRPLNVSGLRRESDDDTISPISMPATYHQFFTPPASVATSETLSPVSPTNDRAPFMAPSYAQPSPRSSNYWGNRPGSFSNYHAPHSAPRLQLHDRMGRTRAESLASPLRTSMSYTGNLDHATTTTEPAVSQPGSGPQQTREYWPEMPVGQHASSYNSLGFSSPALGRQGGPITTTFPPGLNLQPQPRSLQPFSALHNLQQHDARLQQAGSQAGFQNMPQPQASHPAQPLYYGGGSQPQMGDMAGPGGAAPHGLYAVQYPDAENDTINTFGTSGVTSEPTGAAAIEPESYYKSEPYGNRLASGLGYGGTRPHSSSFGAAGIPGHHAVLPRTSQPQQQQAPQQAHQQPQSHQRPPTSPFGAGMKRRRDSLEAGSQPDPSTGEYEGGSRKRSYTMPSGFRGGAGS